MTKTDLGYWYPLATSTMGERETEAVVEVMRSGRTTMGAKVEEFEESFARYVGAAHGVMVNSGSSADLLIALLLPGRDVVVPAVTWPTQVWAWQMAGARVHVADVEGLNATARTLWAAGKSGVVLSLVHLMGVPCEMDPILELADSLDAVIVEDCCEALGASYLGQPVGSFGTAAAWSFFFSHHMTTMEGGMVTTDSAVVAEKLRTLRSHGWARHLADPPEDCDPRYTFVDWGLNVRPTEVAAAIGLVQLERLDEMNHVRAMNRQVFAEVLAPNPFVTLPDVPPGGTASWFGLPFFVERDRANLAAFLEGAGVETRPILAGNLMRQPVAHRLEDPGPLPGADRVHDQGLYVGLHPDRNADLSQVAGLINRYFEL